MISCISIRSKVTFHLRISWIYQIIFTCIIDVLTIEVILYKIQKMNILTTLIMDYLMVGEECLVLNY